MPSEILHLSATSFARYLFSELCSRVSSEFDYQWSK